MRERATPLPPAPSPPTRNAHDERGSSLLLVPAGMLILLVLAAFSFDLALAFQRKRELVELADTAANDAVTYGLDEARLRADGSYCLDVDRVTRSIGATLEASSLPVRVVRIRLLSVDGAPCPTGAELTIETRSPFPFGQAVPGTPDGVTVEATGRATAVTR